MESINKYVDEVRTLSGAFFVERHPHPFFVKHPRTRATLASTLPSFGFATTAAEIAVDPLPDLMQVAPIRKRDGNPFPERLSVGRAPNCDVVLRLPLVSKVHAHLLLQPDGSMVLQDNRASNGTFHNRRRLPEGGQTPLRFGDVIGFGSLEVELVASSKFHELMQRLAA